MDDTLLSLRGIGKRKYQAFQKLSLQTIDQLVFYYPKAHLNKGRITALADIDIADKYALEVTVRQFEKSRIKGGRTMHKFIVEDDTASAQVLFINTPFITNYFHVDGHYYIYGQVSIDAGKLTIFHPEIRPYDEGAFGIEPKYGLTDGLSNKDIRNAVAQCRERIENLTEVLPPSIVAKRHLMARSKAVLAIHFPSDEEVLKDAKWRLKYEELFHLQMALRHRKLRVSKMARAQLDNLPSDAEIAQLFSFQLTGDQMRAISEIKLDMASAMPMNRLLQGDVGSGKTAVAIAAAYCVVQNGLQVALMAPTEILAQQHYETFSKCFSSDQLKLLTASTKDKQALYDAVATGAVSIVIGTHAIIQNALSFANLGLVITDEQHRFGVNQRKALSEKAHGVDVLVMSATPIPRTLSLIVYGDMAISTIKQLPVGRLPIKTHYIRPAKYEAMLDFIAEHLAQGEQVYFVAPLIEESDKIDLVAAEQLYCTIAARYPTYQVALVHGKMSAEQKNEIMNQFKNGKAQVLVSTTVIEVGVDVPQATIMVITHAERFGLSQLHQMRGRVGRGSGQSYCFLTAKAPGKVALERIAMMTKSNDGFAIAEKDLQIRGPGELLGVRQHGLPELKLVDLKSDIDLVKSVYEDCKALFESSEDIADYLSWLESQMVL
ncbi:MAG: ATP-dependent DNA helicase RecG [Clostridiales bacterium]|nr:MAG: ATP-dependent DNA helicase RecG [Clostridiales bacterium]